LALGPALAVALVRFVWFGTAAPLSLSAKPPDLVPGLRYALAAFVSVPLGVVLLAPRALANGGPRVWRLPFAVIAHFGAIALAGGDWMPLFRLVIPIVPAMLLAGAEVVEGRGRAWHWVRVSLAALLSAAVAVAGVWPARAVLTDRLDLIERLRAPLRTARVTATVDAGLVGAATNGAVLDLAGVTDPVIAGLSGGHTSKRVPEGLLESRAVDHAVLLLAPGTRVADPWHESRFAHAVSARIAATPVMQHFELVSELAIGRTTYRYVVVRKATEYAALAPPQNELFR
jgi:hypothetical protein